MTYVDPFGAPDEAQQAPVAAPPPPPPPPPAPAEDAFAPAPPAEEKKPAAARTTKAKAAVVQEGKDGKLSITFKGGTGYDAPWLVLYPSDLDEALDLLSGDNGKTLIDVMQRVQKAGEYFAGLAPVKAGPSGSAQAQQAAAPGAPPAGATQAPGGSRQCKHGEMQYKTGEKNGRVWKAFFCPTPKGTYDQCAAEFLKD